MALSGAMHSLEAKRAHFAHGEHNAFADEMLHISMLTPDSWLPQVTYTIITPIPELWGASPAAALAGEADIARCLTAKPGQ